MLHPKLTLNWIISHNSGKVLAAKLRVALKEVKDDNTRSELITILGGSGRSEAIPPLIDYVVADNSQRTRALLALENLAGDPDLRKEVITLLAERMGTDNPHGTEACMVLEKLANNPELQYEAGLASLRGNNPKVVKWATAMLVKARKQEAIRPLLKLLWRGETFSDGPTRKLRPFRSTTSTRPSPPGRESTAGRASIAALDAAPIPARSGTARVSFTSTNFVTGVSRGAGSGPAARSRFFHQKKWDARNSRSRQNAATLCPLRACAETNLCHCCRAFRLRSRSVIRPASPSVRPRCYTPPQAGKMRFTFVKVGEEAMAGCK